MFDIVILDGARTPIGTFGSSLAAVPPIETGLAVAGRHCSAPVWRPDKSAM